MEQNLVKDKKTGLYYRENTYDLNIIKEMNCYGELEFKNKIILDIGGNIGAFADFALRHGAYKVISVEPELDNFSILKKNSTDKNIICLNFAVLNSSKKEVNIYLNEKKNKAIHSLFIKKGRESCQTVKTININTLIDNYRPEVIKIDIEGSEYYIFNYNQNIASCVRQLAIEFHLTKKRWRLVSSKQLKRYLNSQFNEEIKEPKINGKNWTAIGVYKR